MLEPTAQVYESLHKATGSQGLSPDLLALENAAMLCQVGGGRNGVKWESGCIVMVKYSVSRLPFPSF